MRSSLIKVDFFPFFCSAEESIIVSKQCLFCGFSLKHYACKLVPNFFLVTEKIKIVEEKGSYSCSTHVLLCQDYNY